MLGAEDIEGAGWAAATGWGNEGEGATAVAIAGEGKGACGSGVGGVIVGGGMAVADSTG